MTPTQLDTRAIMFTLDKAREHGWVLTAIQVADGVFVVDDWTDFHTIGFLSLWTQPTLIFVRGNDDAHIALERGRDQTAFRMSSSTEDFVVVGKAVQAFIQEFMNPGEVTFAPGIH